MRCVAFDKTGTLTQGHAGSRGRDGVQRPASARDRRASRLRSSGGPSTRSRQAILQYAAAAGIAALPGDDVRALAGRGAEGRVGGARVLIGNHRLFEERGLCSPALHRRLEDSAPGPHGRARCAGRWVVGLIAVADQAREGARRDRHASAAGDRVARAADGRQRRPRPCAGRGSSASTSFRPTCCRKTRWPPSPACGAGTGRWPWSVTG